MTFQGILVCVCFFFFLCVAAYFGVICHATYMYIETDQCIYDTMIH